jgi:hypothetical protein
MGRLPPRITRIKGITEERRIPRLGKIRLGTRVKIAAATKKGWKRCQCGEEKKCRMCARPIETPHFVVPPEVAREYGEAPTELDIMLPVNDQDDYFPQAYCWYGSRGLKCKGDLELAGRWDDKAKDWVDRECPCEHKDVDCFKRGVLSVVLPRISLGGVYQVSSGSWNTIVDTQSGIDYAKALVDPERGERIALVPLTLRRVEMEIPNPDGKGKSKHWPLKVTLDQNIGIDELNRLRKDTKHILSGVRLALPEADFGQPDEAVPDWQEEEASGEEAAGKTTGPPGESPEAQPAASKPEDDPALHDATDKAKAASDKAQAKADEKAVERGRKAWKDGDKPTTTGPERLITAEQATQLKVALGKAKVPATGFVKVFGVRSVRHIPLSRFDEAVNWIAEQRQAS